MRKVLCATALLAAAVLAGCDESLELRRPTSYGTLTGRVTVAGQPVRGAIVEAYAFEPDMGHDTLGACTGAMLAPSATSTDEAGRYRMDIHSGLTFVIDICLHLEARSPAGQRSTRSGIVMELAGGDPLSIDIDLAE